MLIFFQILLFLGLVYCRFDQRNETITILSGESATLKCSWDYSGSLFWIRLLPGKLPEVLGKLLSSKTADPRIRITEGNQASFLRIERASISDTGYYYCMKYSQKLTFTKEIHLSVEVWPTGLKSTTVASISTNKVHTAASAIEQCSHDSDFSDNIFLGQHSKCCCRSSSISARAPLTTGNNVSASADTKAGFLLRKPLCCLLRDNNTSDVFFCTVSSCDDEVGEQDIDGSANKWHWVDKGPLSLSLAALALSSIVNGCCIYLIRKHKTKRGEAAVPLQQMTSTAETDQQAEQDSLVYSVPDFSRRKSRRSPEEYEECFYTEVRKFGLN